MLAVYFERVCFFYNYTNTNIKDHVTFDLSSKNVNKKSNNVSTETCFKA